MKAVLFSLAAAGTPFLSEKSHQDAFEKFIKDFEKEYASDEERATRYGVFKENRVYINRMNQEYPETQFDINEFADMSHDEFAGSYLHGFRPELKQQWGELPHLGTHQYSGAALPASVDWNAKGAVTPIKNQGQCGSCWAFSTTGSVEGAWEIATGKLVSLSEQQLVDCSKAEGNQGCNGGLMDNGFKYFETAAICTEDSYPYAGKTGTTCKATSCTDGIPAGGVKGFKDVAKDDMNALMEAVSIGPVSIAIEADKGAFQFYKGGVLTQKCGTNLDHGVLLVGYGSLDGKDYWKVKNSWGPSWGQEGFILLERGTSSPDGAAGECGLRQSASYPIVSKSPGPVPPSPTPPTPPSPTPPTPGKGHYEKPPCQSDEVQAQIQGLDGALCAPKCQGQTCPSDKPSCRANPQCALQDQSGNHYCALMCVLDSGCPSDGAKCGKVGGGIFGVCYYPSSQPTSSAVEMTINQPEHETEFHMELRLEMHV